MLRWLNKGPALSLSAMFRVREGKSGGHATICLVNAGTGERAVLIPSYGATLNKLVLATQDNAHHILEGIRDPIPAKRA